jgi:hypothetical protein
MIRTARPGPGKGWRWTMSSGRPSSSPTRRTSSLNSQRSGSTSSNSMSSGSPPTLWCDLIVAAVPCPDSMTSGYSVPWTRNFASPACSRGGVLEDADELLADRLALGLGLGDAGELAEEAVLRVDGDQPRGGVRAEGLLDLLGLVVAHEPVVDVDADELVADGLVDERRGDRRVDAAGQAAQHLRVADLLADGVDGRLDDRVRGPRRPRPGRGEERLDDVEPPRGVGDLGVVLDAEEAPLGVLEGGDRRAGGRPDDPEARRGRGRRRRCGSSTPSGTPAAPRAASTRSSPAARSCRTRCRRSGRPRRRAPAPSAAGRSRCRASAHPHRRSPGRSAGRTRRTPTSARPTG